MKTILEWYQELPEPYRTQAIENCDKELLDEVGDNINEALEVGFYWDKSPQGHNYWSKLNRRLHE